MSKKNTVSFEFSVSGREDGTLEAAYIRILNEDVATTKEIEEDILLADYTSDGRLVGIEILAPTKLSELVKLIKQRDLKLPFRNFVEKSASREFVIA